MAVMCLVCFGSHFFCCIARCFPFPIYDFCGHPRHGLTCLLHMLISCVISFNPMLCVCPPFYLVGYMLYRMFFLLGCCAIVMLEHWLCKYLSLFCSAFREYRNDGV